MAYGWRAAGPVAPPSCSVSTPSCNHAARQAVRHHDDRVGKSGGMLDQSGKACWVGLCTLSARGRQVASCAAIIESECAAGSLRPTSSTVHAPPSTSERLRDTTI